MSAHAYGWRVTCADAVRAAAGLTLVGAPLVVGGLPGWTTALFATAGIVFLAFAAAALGRMLIRVEVSPEALAVNGPRPAKLAWNEIERLRLAYYATRRDGRSGWMELTVADARHRIVIDSRIGGFQAVARHAARAARARALPLDPATVANLREIGLRGGEGSPS